MCMCIFKVFPVSKSSWTPLDLTLTLWLDGGRDSSIPFLLVWQMGELCDLRPVSSLNFHCVEFAHALLIGINHGL